MSRFLRKRGAALMALALAAIPAAAAPYPRTDHFGVPFSTDEAWYRQCMRVEKMPPEADAGKAPAGCDATGLYYRKRGQAQTSAAEWEQVRQCAIGTDNKQVLMMLYANGYGVARDTDRAIHYACSLDFVAKSEMVHRVAHLAGDPAEARNHGKLFDLCDDITSGAMGAVCADIRESQDKRVREARLAHIARALAPAGRLAFARLRTAAERYADAGAREVDGHGTAAADFATRRQAHLREEFMQAALDAYNGKLPAVSPEQFAERDRELNTRYQALMATPSKDPDEPDRIGESTITHKDVRELERLWLAYRDAFAAFGATLGPASDPNAVRAALTSQRIAVLADIAKYE